MIPLSTYRLQFHPGFTLRHARTIVPYLADLGVSHVYASPLFEARAGSSHGYDVTDPTRIRAALGGEDELRALSEDLAGHGMGLILDIVPNHMAASPQNPWWADMLRLGQSSPHAHFFDVDWNRHGGTVLLPVLGTPLEEAMADGHIELVQGEHSAVLRLYGEEDYPLAPGSLVEGDLGATLANQHYTLAWWKLGHDELNWRRFFSISELAGLQIGRDDVFEAVHRLPLRLYRDGVIDGLRIDHVDGLADPAAYLAKLRERLEAQGRDDGPAWLIVEKILGNHETLPGDWPIDGTTGYDFMEEVSLLLHPASEAEPLARRWTALSGRSADFEDEERLARRQLLRWEFHAQFEACADALFDLAQQSRGTVRYSRAAWARAVEALVIAFPVYRTYGTGNAAPPGDEWVRKEAARRLPALAPPGEAELGHCILAWLAGEGPSAGHPGKFVRLFQQLSAPIAAKAVEDTAFYRYGRWISRNDVGFDPARFSADASAFHESQQRRLENWPGSMLATATHDHKRGEDVRARLAAIAELAGEWEDQSALWTRALPGTDRLARGDVEMLLQAAVGAWPEDPRDLPEYASRLSAYAVKTLREAKLRSSWSAPDEGYERAADQFVRTLVSGSDAAATRVDIADFLERVRPIEQVKSLAQTFLRLTCPGIPDTYQGAELSERSLVDPDNRRPVDFGLRERTLRDRSDRKLALLRDCLHLRAQRPAVFQGGYEPLACAEGCIAFSRGDGHDRLVMITALRALPGEPADWIGPTLPEAGPSLLGGELPCAVFADPRAD